jgi:hypothetical protein
MRKASGRGQGLALVVAEIAKKVEKNQLFEIINL